MFYNNRGRGAALTAATSARRRSINPERPSRIRRRTKNGKPSNNQHSENRSHASRRLAAL
jgi:hypothetical protein